ncbi:MAG: hypothetical protein JSR91_17480 [Proteobacteria bacterium]|nr:hypothetical protein [Pseudomonadota bacterium]
MMRGVNDRNFFNLWQILYRATCPNPRQVHWQIGDVDWRKDRHSFSGTDYAVTLEVHHLRHAGRGAWTLMVAVEHWWDGAGAALKTTTWARVVQGNPKSIIGWLQQQEQCRTALGRPGDWPQTGAPR